MSSTSTEIKQILKEHLSKVREISGEWDTLLNNKTLEINNLKDTVRELRAKGGKQSQVLQEGIDAYIGKRTRDLQQSLAGAKRERDDAQKQLEEQKKANRASQSLAKGLKSKNAELTGIIANMRSCDNYDVNAVNVEIVAERDKLQRMYNDLKVKSKRSTFEFDQHFKDKLDSLCDTISKTKPLNNLSERNRFYQQRLNQKESELQRAKNKPAKTLDDDPKEQTADGSETAKFDLSNLNQTDLIIVTVIVLFFLITALQ